MPGFTECCEKCPNKTINQNYCYNGRPCFECPAYNNLDSNEPPDDIRNMLQQDGRSDYKKPE